MTAISPDPKPEQPAGTALPRRRSPVWRVLRISGALALGMVAFVALIPHLLATDFVRERLERVVTRELGTEVGIDGYSFGWFGGLSLSGLRVEDPEATSELPLLALERMEAQFSLPQLIRGRVDLRATVVGLVLNLRQDEAGDTNVGIVVRRSKHYGTSRRRTEERDPDEPRILALMDRLHLDLELRESQLTLFRADGGVLERLTGIESSIRKERGRHPLRMSVAANLERPDEPDRLGKIELALQAAPDPEVPAMLEMNCVGLDLSRYQPLLQAMLPEGHVSAFAGRVKGACSAHYSYRRELAIEGLFEVEQPRFAGELFGGGRLQARRWELRPDLVLRHGDEGWETADSEGMELDLEFLQVRGIRPPAGSRPGTLAFEIKGDLDRAAGLLQPLLGGGEVRYQGATLRGSARVDGNRLLQEWDPVGATDLAMELRASQIDIQDQEIRDLRATLALESGALHAQVQEPTLLAGGPLRFSAHGDLDSASDRELQLRLSLDDAALRGHAIEPLRRVLPLLAGRLPPAAVDVGVRVDLGFEGSLRVPEGEAGASRWLQNVRGLGQLAIEGGSIYPASELSKLFAVTAGTAGWQISAIHGSFHLDHGAVETSVMDFGDRKRTFTLSGRTDPEGRMDYRVDLTALLDGHRDGERAKALLGDRILEGRIRGTVEAPRVTGPDLGDLLRRAAERQLQQEAQKGLNDLFRKVLKKKGG